MAKDLQQALREIALTRGIGGNFQATMALAASVLLDDKNEVQIDGRDLAATFSRLANSTGALAALMSIGVAPGQPSYLARTAVPLTLLTSATPADIGTIALPAWLTRYTVPSVGSSSTFVGAIVAETAAGTLAAGTIQVRDTAAGAGNTLNSIAGTPPATAAAVTRLSNQSANPLMTSSTLYINQTGNAANAGTISVYVLLIPLL